MKPIPEWPGYFACKNGEIFSRKLYHGETTPRRLTTITTNGYRKVNLYCRRRARQMYVHHLVLITFVGPRQKGMECCHGPKGKLDNSLKNLSWGTRSKNNLDRVRDGKGNRGERSPMAKLNELQVRVIRTLNGVMTQREAGAYFGVLGGTIGAIWARRIWKHL